MNVLLTEASQILGESTLCLYVTDKRACVRNSPRVSTLRNEGICLALPSKRPDDEAKAAVFHTHKKQQKLLLPQGKTQKKTGENEQRLRFVQLLFLCLLGSLSLFFTKQAEGGDFF